MAASFYLLPGVFNVKSYGAAGDGTTDDRAAVQAAVNAAAGAGVVYFPAGTYRVVPSGGIGIDVTAGNNFRLAGAGAGLSVIRRDGSGDTIRGTTTVPGDNYSAPTARDLGFRPLSGTGNEIRIAAFRNLSLENLNFSGCDTCINLGSASAMTSIAFLANLSAGNYNQFLRLCRTLDVWCYGLSVNANSPPGTYTAGIHMDGGCQGCDFVNCDVIGAGGSTGNGLEIIQSDYTVVGTNDTPSYNEFTNCLFDNSGVGVYASHGTLNTFSNCWFSNRGAAGVQLTSGAKGYSFAGCVAANNNGHGYTLAGTDVEINGGFAVANGSSSHGINITAGTGYRIRGVRATNGYNFGGTQLYGINIASGVDDFVVKDNDCRGNATGGINNAAGTGATKIVSDNL